MIIWMLFRKKASKIPPIIRIPIMMRRETENNFKGEIIIKMAVPSLPYHHSPF